MKSLFICPVVCLYVQESVCVCSSVCLFSCLSVYSSEVSVCLFSCLCVCSTAYLFGCLCVCSTVCQSHYLYLLNRPFVSSPFCESVQLSAHLSVCLFSCLLHCSTVLLSVHLNLSVQQYITPLNHIFLSLNVCLFVQLPLIPCSSSLFVCPHTQSLCLHILLIPPFLTFSLSFDPILCPSVTSSLFLYQLVFNQTVNF